MSMSILHSVDREREKESAGQEVELEPTIKMIATPILSKGRNPRQSADKPID